MKKWFKCIDKKVWETITPSNINTTGLVFCYTKKNIEWFNRNGNTWKSPAEDFDYWKGYFTECSEKEAMEFLIK